MLKKYLKAMNLGGPFFEWIAGIDSEQGGPLSASPSLPPMRYVLAPSINCSRAILANTFSMTCSIRVSQDTFRLEHFDHTKSLVDVTTLCLDVTISTVRIDWPLRQRGWVLC
jgi:hypothetical protein